MYQVKIKTQYETIEFQIEDDELLSMLKLYAGTYQEIEVNRIGQKEKKLVLKK